MVAMFFSRTNSFLFSPSLASLFISTRIVLPSKYAYKRNLSTHEDHQVEEEKNLFIYTYNVYKKAYVVHVRVS